VNFPAICCGTGSRGAVKSAHDVFDRRFFKRQVDHFGLRADLRQDAGRGGLVRTERKPLPLAAELATDVRCCRELKVRRRLRQVDNETPGRPVADPTRRTPGC